MSGNFKAVRTNFITSRPITTASTIGKNTLPEIDPLVPGRILRIESAGRRLVNGDGTDVDRTRRRRFRRSLPSAANGPCPLRRRSADGRLDTQRSKPDYGRASLLAQKRGGIFAVDEIDARVGLLSRLWDVRSTRSITTSLRSGSIS